jgi:hypothetical protein
MIVNPDRIEAGRREDLTVFVNSAGWTDVLRGIEEDIVKPLRAKALKDAALDPREHTGVVRALQAVRQCVEYPYKKLADSSGKKLDEVLPGWVERLFT